MYVYMYMYMCTYTCTCTCVHVDLHVYTGLPKLRHRKMGDAQFYCVMHACRPVTKRDTCSIIIWLVQAKKIPHVLLKNRETHGKSVDLATVHVHVHIHTVCINTLLDLI